MSVEQLGAPLTEPYAIPGGEARLYEGGLTINGVEAEVVVSFAFPMIGRPSIVSGDPMISPPFEPDAINFQVGNWTEGQLTPMIQAALAGRLALVPTGQPSVQVPLTVGRADVIRPAEETGVGGVVIPAVYGLLVTLGGVPAERQLYDVAARGDGDIWHVVAPHALYHRQTWSDFGVAHITDMHVARRIDTFRDLLIQIGRHDAATRMYNWNNRFRGFVRYANYLHSMGILDVIVATGDLYDYIYEDDDDPAGGGNAEFLRQLVLGQLPGPGFQFVEELRVPIFMVPGNHDYRRHPYKLIFDAQVRFDLILLGIGKDVARVKNFYGYCMLQEDAQALQNALDGRSGTDIQNLGEGPSARMVEVDPGISAYKRFIADRGSYVVRLGPHRIAMIDSNHDVGMVTSLLDGLRGLLGMQSEDEQTFVGGSPNCEGVSLDELAMVTDVLREVPADGLVMVGLHAPLFNVWNNEYPYFLRYTQRPEQAGQDHGFLARHDGQLVRPGASIEEQVEPRHPTWFAGERDHRDPRFVIRVESQDMLDFGVSRDQAEELMARLAGVNSPRRADVVLAGHTHKRNEFIVRPMETGELAFYLDFYTENPARAYPTRYTTTWQYMPALGGSPERFVPVTDVTYVEVVPGAAPDATPWPMPWDALHGKQVQVPPYATPLSTAPDPKAWWDQHRPLVLQTGALGPLENSQVSFTGFRVLSVKANIIEKIHYISTERLEVNDYRLPFEDAVRTDPVRRHVYVERSRPLNAPLAAGPPAGIVFPALGVTNIVYRDDHARLHELWQKGAEFGTSNLTDLAGAIAAASDPTSFIATAEGLEVALYRGVDGHVHSLYWSTGAVGRDALSGPVGAPQAIGAPVGYVGPDNYSHVYYRTGAGHLIEMWWTGPDAPGWGDLTDLSGAPAAVGDPSAYVIPATNENVVAYRGSDRHIHTMYWSTGDVGHDNLSGYAGAPLAYGEPVAYYIPHLDAHQVTYRADNGHLYELWWLGAAPVTYWDVTAAAGAPLADSDPAAYYSVGTNTKHLVYRSADGHLNEIWWVPGAAPAHVDLSIFAHAPLAVGKPTAFTVEGPNSQHVAYRGVDGRVHEIRWV